MAKTQNNGFIDKFIKQNKPQIEKYKRYIEENDWATKFIVKKYNKKEKLYITTTDYDSRNSEYIIQNRIVDTIYNRLKHFVKKAEADLHLKKSKDIMDFILESIDVHIHRVESYLDSSDISTIKNDRHRSSEIDFQNNLYKNLSKLDDNISELNIESEADEILFYNNAKAPLSLHHVISAEFPEINKKLEDMGIDFESSPKDEMLIHIKNPPKWNIDKHYWEQDKKVLQFYVDEYKKIKSGITIDGVYISGWMYTQMNVFKTYYPQEKYNNKSKKYEVEDVLGHPPLRDNEWFIIQDSYEKAKLEDKMMFLCATRRAAKTTLIASHLQWKALCGGKTLVVAGGSAKDLGQIERNFRTTVTNSHPAFSLPNTTNDWSKKVVLGIKKKNQKNIVGPTLNVVNLNSGGEKSSEVLAGFTPDAFVLDECMKAPFLDQLNAAKPAFDSPYGKRLVPILSGTGSSNDDLVKDAFVILQDPESEDVSNMDWNALERNMEPEDITWKRRNFGTFLPGQMSAKVGMVKVSRGLDEYLSVKSKSLNKITINVTNWKDNKIKIEEDRKSKRKNEKTHKKEVVYYPIDPEEIFLSGKNNPFPAQEAKRHLEKIKETGDTGKLVDLFRKGENIEAEMSVKKLPEFPHRGGFWDSPVMLFEELPETPPPYGMYVSGLDDYKQEEAGTDSLGSMYIFKRDVLNDAFAYRIVASLTTRPNPHSKAHKNWLMLLEAFNATCLMENEDLGFKDFLDTKHITDQWLVPSFSMAGDLTVQGNQRRAYGVSPHGGNKGKFVSAVVKYCNEEHTIYTEDGPQQIMGVELINDVGLLEEIINYKEGGNFDRIVAFGIALLQEHYLTTNYVLFNEIPKPKKKEEDRPKRVNRRPNAFRKSSGSIFRK